MQSQVVELPSARISRDLRQWITQRQLVAGERLPSEQELARQFNVARHTLRLAIGELEREGLVVSMGRRRGRVMASAHPPLHSLMSTTVVVLTDMPVNPHELAGAGWPAYLHVSTSEALRDAGVPVMTLHSEHVTGDQVQRLAQDRPLGAIVLQDSICAERAREVLESLARSRIPTVVCGDAAANNCDRVASDHEAGAYELVKWLAAHGRRRILRYWGVTADASERPAWLTQRDAGYERGMRDAGLEVLPPVEFSGVVNSPDFRTRWELSVNVTMGALLQFVLNPNPVDALIAISDGAVLTISAALRRLGKIPNQDVFVCGYDNYWKECAERKFEATAPMLTVDKQNAAIGQECVALLLARISGKLAGTPEVRVLKPQLIVNSEFTS